MSLESLLLPRIRSQPKRATTRQANQAVALIHEEEEALGGRHIPFRVVLTRPALSSLRLLMVTRLAAGWTVAAVAASFGVDPKTVRKWRDRHATEGEGRGVSLIS